MVLCRFSDVTFDWHCDDSANGPRDISLVAYFTDPDAYTGGQLEINLNPPAAISGGDTAAAGLTEPTRDVCVRRYAAGSIVAFPSKLLEHRVTAVRIH
jgi:predicted 2-oxoglutarate/Fe(II)-dependent dioxygenase YbiX